MYSDINLDNIVDYAKEYEVIKGHRIQGSRMTGLCPFHDDKNASFSVDLKTGKYKCFSCGEEGNFITFTAKLNNLSTTDAYKAILEKYHIPLVEPQRTKYTVNDYAEEKHLPATYLRETFKLADGVDRDKKGYIKIEYFDEKGQPVRMRKRYRKTENPRFKWGKDKDNAGMLLYGLWRLEDIRKKKSVVLVEGESDTQTLWYLGIPALGVPGASMFREEWTALFEGIDRVYIHVEPDKGGQNVFLPKTISGLANGKYSGSVYKWGCAALGEKDPSDLYCKEGKDAASEKIHGALQSAERLDIYRENIPEVIPKIPVRLKQPENWTFSKDGIFSINPKTMEPTHVCRTPIIITKRLRSTDTGEEKIELAFYRDNEWQRTIKPRSVVFQSRSVTCLTDLSCTVTSENAKAVVKYLEALEAENYEIIDKAESTGRLGWHTKGRFLPGLGKDLVPDFEGSAQTVDAYEAEGSLDSWVKVMQPHRERDKFRFILAAAFAAPLLRIIKLRTFFIYNWGGSRGGKTAALYAALSAWGDPEQLKTSFDATRVGLERMASLYCDLPLGIDERQLAGDRQNFLETAIYAICSEKGKTRGAKTGGLQITATWNTIAISTGEVPITKKNTMSGVMTRVMEIYGAPFDKEDDASRMYQYVARYHGTAGPEYIKRIILLGNEAIITRYQEIYDYVCREVTASKKPHAANVSIVAAADSFIDEMFFGGEKDASVARAKEMALNILTGLTENELGDVNENAHQYLRDWIFSNAAFFKRGCEMPKNQCYGEFTTKASSQEIESAYVYPSIMDDALEKGGYDSRKTVKYLAEIGILGTYKNKNGKIRFSENHYINGTHPKMYQVFLIKDENNLNLQTELSDCFEDVKDIQEELPF